MQSTGTVTTKRVSSMKDLSFRPKRRCMNPSVIEPPVIECVKDVLKVGADADADADKIIPVPNGRAEINFGEINGLCNESESRNKTFDERGLCQFTTGDAFEKMVVEPPKLENSFSQFIMTDEIKAHLPTDSQQSINLDLHLRVQRLENLVAMLMQQKNDEMELLLK